MKAPRPPRRLAFGLDFAILVLTLAVFSIG
jgi:hypothetical protein